MNSNLEIYEGKLIIKNQFAGRSLAIFTSGGDAPGKKYNVCFTKKNLFLVIIKE